MILQTHLICCKQPKYQNVTVFFKTLSHPQFVHVRESRIGVMLQFSMVIKGQINTACCLELTIQFFQIYYQKGYRFLDLRSIQNKRGKVWENCRKILRFMASLRTLFYANSTLIISANRNKKNHKIVPVAVYWNCALLLIAQRNYRSRWYAKTNFTNQLLAKYSLLELEK